MRIVFVLDNLVNENLGTMILSSIAKELGHKVSLSVRAMHFSMAKFVDEVQSYEPDMICCSVMTATADEYERMSAAIKQRMASVPVIWGGAHPTFMPGEVTKLDCVDALALGEAEISWKELLLKFPDIRNINGFWVRTESGWIKNPVTMFPENLDVIPLPDRDLLYDKSYILRHFAMKRVLASRGCPYKCSFCFEPAMRDMYGNHKGFVRMRSPDMVVEEIKILLEKYPVGRHIHFSDDSFNLNFKWMEELCWKLKNEIGLSYSVNLAVPLITQQVVDVLAQTGCRCVVVGLETANENTRRDRLSKPVSDSRFLQAAEMLKKAGIWLVTNVMFGLPAEGADDWVRAIDMNIELGAFGSRYSILKAYKGTHIANQLTGDMCESVDRYTVRLKLTPEDRQAMEILAQIGAWAVMFGVSGKTCKRLIYSRYARFLKPLIIFDYPAYLRQFRLPIWQAVWYFLLNIKLFLAGMGHKQDEKDRN